MNKSARSSQEAGGDDMQFGDVAYCQAVNLSKVNLCDKVVRDRVYEEVCKKKFLVAVLNEAVLKAV